MNCEVMTKCVMPHIMGPEGNEIHILVVFFNGQEPVSLIMTGEVAILEVTNVNKFQICIMHHSVLVLKPQNHLD